MFAYRCNTSSTLRLFRARATAAANANSTTCTVKSARHADRNVPEHWKRNVRLAEKYIRNTMHAQMRTGVKKRVARDANKVRLHDHFLQRVCASLDTFVCEGVCVCVFFSSPSLRARYCRCPDNMCSRILVFSHVFKSSAAADICLCRHLHGCGAERYEEICTSICTRYCCVESEVPLT